jgi:putative mRNA 3-end processing factor
MARIARTRVRSTGESFADKDFLGSLGNRRVTAHPATWLQVCPQGLLVKPGGFFVDPTRPVGTAVITHGHSDHARGGHDTVIATPETLAVMTARLGELAGRVQRPLALGQRVEIGEVAVWLAPAGHVLGSAQIVLEHGGCRVVVSGDYKRRPDPTCAPFEPVPCDLFITEATFGLPIFCHPPVRHEILRLLESVALFPERCHVVGAYALGKTQRLIAELRRAGWDRPIYLHGALQALCDLYERHGVALGDLRPATAGQKGQARKELEGQIVIAPPGAIAERWARRLPDPVVCLASGWMGVKQRARQRGVELPLVVSDHADWDELLTTIEEVQAGEVWVTHGREEALVHAAGQRGIRARALAIVGYDEEGA